MSTTFSGTVTASAFAGDVTGDITGNVTGAVTLPTYAVAGLPAADESDGMVVHCSDGAGGSPCLAYSNGTNWLRIAFGAAVAAS